MIALAYRVNAYPNAFIRCRSTLNVPCFLSSVDGPGSVCHVDDFSRDLICITFIFPGWIKFGFRHRLASDFSVRLSKYVTGDMVVNVVGNPLQLF